MKNSKNNILEKIKAKRQEIFAGVMAGVMAVTGLVVSNKLNNENKPSDDRISDAIEDVLPNIPSFDELVDMFNKEQDRHEEEKEDEVIQELIVSTNSNIKDKFNSNINGSQNNVKDDEQSNIKDDEEDNVKDDEEDNVKEPEEEKDYKVLGVYLINSIDRYHNEVGLTKDVTIRDILNYIEENYGKGIISPEEVESDLFLKEYVNDYILKKITPIKPITVNPVDYMTILINSYNEEVGINKDTTIKTIVDWYKNTSNSDKNTMDSVYGQILSSNTLKDKINSIIEELLNMQKPTGPNHGGGSGGGSITPPAHEHDYVLTATKVVSNANGTHTIFKTYTCLEDGSIKVEQETVDCEYDITVDGDKIIYTCKDPECGYTYTQDKPEHTHVSDGIIHYGYIDGVFSEYNLCIEDGTPMNVRPHICAGEIKYTYESNHDGTHTISAKKICACGNSEDVELENTVEDCPYTTEISEDKTKITYTCEYCGDSYTKDYHEQEHIHNFETVSDDGPTDEYCHIYHQKCSGDGCEETNIEYVKHIWQLISNDGRWASIRCINDNYDLEIRSSEITNYIPDYVAPSKNTTNNATSVSSSASTVLEEVASVPDIDYDNYVVETFDDFELPVEEPVVETSLDDIPDIDYDNYVVETFDDYAQNETVEEEQPLTLKLVKDGSGE